jgi:hypothetical protein
MTNSLLFVFRHYCQLFHVSDGSQRMAWNGLVSSEKSSGLSFFLFVFLYHVPDCNCDGEQQKKTKEVDSTPPSQHRNLKACLWFNSLVPEKRR